MINEISVIQQIGYQINDLNSQSQVKHDGQPIGQLDNPDYLLNSSKNNKQVDFDGKREKISNDLLEGIKEEFDIISHLELKFSRDKETGETYIKILDKENGKVVREIPPEEVRKLAEKLQKMIGILFDKRV